MNWWFETSNLFNYGGQLKSRRELVLSWGNWEDRTGCNWTNTNRCLIRWFKSECLDKPIEWENNAKFIGFR